MTNPEGEDSSILHELEETTSPAEARDVISPTKKGGTIRGIFSKWRSSSQEASVDKGDPDAHRLLLAESGGGGGGGGGKQRESSIFGLLPLAALRAAASRENLDDGGNGASVVNSPGASPGGSPSFLSKQVCIHKVCTRQKERQRNVTKGVYVKNLKLWDNF